MNGNGPRLAQVAGAYFEWAPVTPLREHVRCLWVNDLSDSPATLIQVVPDGCVDIIWTKAGIQVVGPDTRPLLEALPLHGLAVGIRFDSGIAFSWLGVPLKEIRNTRVPLAKFWNGDAERLASESRQAEDAATIARRLELALLARLPQVGSADRSITFLWRAGGEDCDRSPRRIARLAEQIGLSERTLRRRCMDVFGYGLKTLNRIMRSQHTVAGTPHGDFYRRSSASLNRSAIHAEPA